jgi:phosphoribosyl 1,2-cyclic phosphodiesterase
MKAMKLILPGTRANIERTSRAHRRHSVLLVLHRGTRIMIDCGADWRGRTADFEPQAILLTHAHPDHVGGLIDGAPCRVYATRAMWALLARWPIVEQRVIWPLRPIMIGGVRCLAWPVEHSLLAPAVGYRLSAAGRSLFYAPDVAAIPRLRQALRGMDAYVGDGSALARPLVRRRGRMRIGHASIAQQLEWCSAAGVGRAVFTHCGSPILRMGDRAAGEAVRALAEPLGIRASIACDGTELRL